MNPPANDPQRAGSWYRDPTTGMYIGFYDAQGRFIRSSQPMTQEQVNAVGAPGGQSTGPAPIDPNTGRAGANTGQVTTGGGTQNPNGPGYGDTNGTSQLDGYAGDYFASLPLGETVYDNPAPIFNHLLNTPQWQAIYGPSNSSNPLNQALADLPYDPLTLWAATVGATEKGFAGGDVGSYTNFLADMAANLLSPGGQSWDFTELMNNMFNSGEGTVLNSMLTSGSGPQQVSNFYNATRDIARASLNPLAAQAALTQARNTGNDYLSSYIGGQNNMTFDDWAAQNRPAMMGSFTQR